MQSIAHGVTSAGRAASNQSSVRPSLGPIMRELSSTLSGTRVSDCQARTRSSEDGPNTFESGHSTGGRHRCPESIGSRDDAHARGTDEPAISREKANRAFPEHRGAQFDWWAVKDSNLGPAD
jgi:hypothetical protein